MTGIAGLLLSACDSIDSSTITPTPTSRPVAKVCAIDNDIPYPEQGKSPAYYWQISGAAAAGVPLSIYERSLLELEQNRGSKAIDRNRGTLVAYPGGSANEEKWTVYYPIYDCDQ